jgi:hypothetical protein
MTREIGWYVHHQGLGHLQRLRAIAPHLDAVVRCFSSLPAPAPLPTNVRWTQIPRDDDRPAGFDAEHADPTVRGLLHWAPRRHDGHRERFAAIVAAVAAAPVDAFVVDVSAEVTLLVRLLGIPTVIITQPGARHDDAHALAFRAADAIIAPWPEALLRPAHLRPHADRIVFTGGISRFDGRATDDHIRRSSDVVVLGGRGGSAVTDEHIDQARRATGVAWRVLGATPGAAWVDDPWPVLRAAGAVVSWTGQNAVADVAAAGAPAVFIPQARPFGEQEQTAAALATAGVAVVEPGWPAATEWPRVLRAVQNLGGDWSRWEVAGAAARAADAIESVAG